MSSFRQAPMCAALVLLAPAAPVRADPLDDARTLARGGQILTGFGAGFDLAGAGLLMGAFFTPSCAFAIAAEPGQCGYSASRDSEVRALFVGGILVSIVGDVTLAVGAAEWSIGVRRIKRLSRVAVVQ